jgi:hypothetical protein
VVKWSQGWREVTRCSKLAVSDRRELGTLDRELVHALREKRPRAERQALLDRELAKAQEFAAIDIAMDEAIRTKFLAPDAVAMATLEWPTAWCGAARINSCSSIATTLLYRQ